MRVTVAKDNSINGLFSDAEIDAICKAANEVVENSKAAEQILVSPVGKRQLTEEEHYNTAVKNICDILADQLANECYFVPEIEE